MSHKRGLSLEEIVVLLKELYYNESHGGELFEMDGETDDGNFVSPVSCDTDWWGCWNW